MCRCSLFGALLLLGSAAASAECGKDGLGWVRVRFAPSLGGASDAGFQRAALADLAAGLRARQLDTCTADQGPDETPFATVLFTPTGEHRIMIQVRLHAPKTGSSVEREVDLSSVPADGRAFAMAIAADELIGASLAEFALKPEPTEAPPAPVPSEPRDDIPTSTAPAPARAASRPLGVVLALASMERFSGGQILLGGDAVFSLPVSDELSGRVGLGLRRGLEQRASSGRIDCRALGLNAGFRQRLLLRDPLSVGFEIDARAAWVTFQGHADAPASDATISGLVMYARTGVDGALRVWGPLLLEAGLGFGIPVRALEATEARKVVIGVSGAELSAALGVGWEL
jgi:hypothetical protein